MSKFDLAGSAEPAMLQDDPEIRVARPDEGPMLRSFCLDIINEAFGIDYRPDWHADLDDLERGDHAYLERRRGSFLVASSGNRVIGTAGLRPLGTAPHLERRFADRYPAPSEVGSVWRTYIDPSHRSQGVGSGLIHELERTATSLGYRRLYLHTSNDSPRAVSFWQGQGYEVFSTDEAATVHLDKKIDG